VCFAKQKAENAAHSPQPFENAAASSGACPRLLEGPGGGEERGFGKGLANELEARR
jgi:hypothetical protein